jgi:uncharacterized membrane protein (DUF373 family)
MSRSGNVDVVTVKPANNVYTVLAIVALLIVVGALAALYVKAKTEFGPPGLF